MGPFFLWQQDDGTFLLGYADILNEIRNGSWPLVNPGGGEAINLLLELRAVDVDGDGDDDLLVGWGHGSAYASVFLSDVGMVIIWPTRRADGSFIPLESAVTLTARLSSSLFAPGKASFKIDQRESPEPIRTFPPGMLRWSGGKSG